MKLSDLHPDLAEMVLESYEASKSVRSCTASALEKAQRAENELRQVIAELTEENKLLISKEIAKVQVMQQNFIKDAEDELRRRIREKTDLDLTIRSM